MNVYRDEHHLFKNENKTYENYFQLGKWKKKLNNRHTRQGPEQGFKTAGWIFLQN